MTTSAPRTVQAAHALWALVEREVDPVGDVQAAIDLLFTLLEAGLRRWIGAEGYASLLSRSLANTLPTHPALSSIPDLGTDTHGGVPDVTSLAADDAARRDAVIALLATMMQQLGGIIGEEMATRLIELSGTPTPRGVAAPEAKDPSS